MGYLDKPARPNLRYAFLYGMLRAYGLKDDALIVDCGCSQGVNAEVLIFNGFKVLGFDILKNSVNLAKNVGLKAQIGNIIEGLPLEDNTADLFICSETLEHLRDTTEIKAVKEINRITKPGGLIAVTVPSHKESSLKNKYHHQYLGMEKLIELFGSHEILWTGKFHKNANPDKGSSVLVARCKK